MTPNEAKIIPSRELVNIRTIRLQENNYLQAKLQRETRVNSMNDFYETPVPLFIEPRPQRRALKHRFKIQNRPYLVRATQCCC